MLGAVLFLSCVGVLLLLSMIELQKKKEGLAADEDFSAFTGLVFFTKTKDCDACKEIKGSIILLYERFPNNIRVVDCTVPFNVSKILTEFGVDKEKLPTILTFKTGLHTTYNGYTTYEVLEDFLLKLMSSQKPTTKTDNTVASLTEIFPKN